MILITADIALDENEIQLEFIRSSGPGGQHVNKVSTAVQLRFNVSQSSSLSDSVRRRVLQIGGSKLTREGIVVITARRYRSQEQNRKDAIQRLIQLIRRAAMPAKIRRKTTPAPAARQRRLQAKRQRGQLKQQRKSPGYTNDQ